MPMPLQTSAFMSLSSQSHPSSQHFLHLSPMSPYRTIPPYNLQAPTSLRDCTHQLTKTFSASPAQNQQFNNNTAIRATPFIQPPSATTLLLVDSQSLNGHNKIYFRQTCSHRLQHTIPAMPHANTRQEVSFAHQAIPVQAITTHPEPHLFPSQFPKSNSQ